MIKITFGIIVLNGEPFTKYCLRQLYPFAYEIIVVEGGSRWAIDQAMQFYKRPADERARQIERIMEEARDRFRHTVTEALLQVC